MSTLTKSLTELFEEYEVEQTLIVSKEDLTNILKNSTLNIEFTKIDGSLRNMICTLNEYLLPALKELSETYNAKKPRAQNCNTIIVYDREMEDWRSIRLNSILSFHEVQENTTSG